MNSVVKLPDKNTVVPITDNLDGWTIQDGKPEMKSWTLNTSNDGSKFLVIKKLRQEPIMQFILNMSLCMYYGTR